MRRVRGGRRRRCMVGKLRQPQQQTDQGQRQQAQRRKPPAAIGQAGQRNRDGGRQARRQAHGQHIGGGQARYPLGKIALEQAGQQHIAQGDARADDGRARIQTRGGALRAHDHARRNQQHRREQRAFQPKTAGQPRREQRYHCEGQKRQGDQHPRGRRRQPKLFADHADQRRHAGERRAQGHGDAQDARDQQRRAAAGGVRRRNVRHEATCKINGECARAAFCRRQAYPCRPLPSFETMTNYP
ncbi:hypothetical protein D3C85_276550 [compost metagenome]